MPLHPYVHRRAAAERQPQHAAEFERAEVDEVPQRPCLPWRLRDLRPEVLQVFREARRGET